MKYRAILLVAAATAALAATAAHAANVWDAVDDFSIAGNPNGPWSYGSGTAGQTFSPMTVSATGFSGSFQSWTVTNPVLGTPSVGKDIGGPFSSGTVLIVPGVLYVHPGPATDVIVQWTAPATGNYDYSGSFEILDNNPSGVIGEVFANGTKEFSGLLTGPPANLGTLTPGGSESFSGSVGLNAGETLSFAVNNDNNFLFDSTGLMATIACISCGPPPPPIPAIATLSSHTVNFGAVRAGTPNPTAKTTVTNTATGFPVDDLNVTAATGLPSNVSVNGALPTGLASGQSGDIGFLLDTTTPGVVGGTATLGFTSTSAAESLTLPTQQVSFAGTVTQLANGVIVLDSGSGVLTGGGTSFQLDLGSIDVSTGLVTSDLGVLNDIANTAYAETLGGSFSGGSAKGYAFSGAPFSGLVGGSTAAGDLLTFDTSSLHDGVYTDKITFKGVSSYPGLSDQNLSPIVLTVTATIFGASAVPEPSDWAMMVIGLGGLGATIRSRRRAILAA